MSTSRAGSLSAALSGELTGLVLQGVSPTLARDLVSAAGLASSTTAGSPLVKTGPLCKLSGAGSLLTSGTLGCQHKHLCAQRCTRLIQLACASQHVLDLGHRRS